MHLYNLTISGPTSVTSSCVGQFSGTRTQEICIVRGGSRLELLLPNKDTGELKTIIDSNAFGVIRSIVPFRLTGATKDFLILGSDSGSISILEFIPSPSPTQPPTFRKLHQETFGRSGSRRIVPGQYLAADPRGRAVMIGAVEKAKLVYILNRDASGNLTISSPLEAHRPRSIVYSIIGLDVGYENPMFAALEIDYTESDQDPEGVAFAEAEKLLTYYELDLGLNHVVRKWSDTVHARSNLLLHVPGGQSPTTGAFDGPSGVLVCSEGYVTYKHQDAQEHRVPIPRRAGATSGGEKKGTNGTVVNGDGDGDEDDEGPEPLIVSWVMHKMKGAFFFLLQTEQGDLFKVTVDHSDGAPLALKIKYFDTVPVSSSMTILRSGFLFVSSESGPPQCYHFESLAEEDDQPEFSSTDYTDCGAGFLDPLPKAWFSPHPLQNLNLAYEMMGLNPATGSCWVKGGVTGDEANAAAAQTGAGMGLMVSCGTGARSLLKKVEYGVDVPELIDPEELPLPPNGLWTIKLKAEDEHHSYVVLSFPSAIGIMNGVEKRTLILSVGETIEEVDDMGFLTSVPTLAAQQMGIASLIQIHPTAVRHLGPNQRLTEWSPPRSTTITQAATNQQQIVIALSSEELAYFEMDLDGEINEFQERRAIGSPIVTLCMAQVPEGRQRTPYLAVGCADRTVRIISLDLENTLEVLSIQALTALPASISIAEMDDSSIDPYNSTMFVNIGLDNGVLLRTILDKSSGRLEDSRPRFMGLQPVRQAQIMLEGSPAILAMSSQTWINHSHRKRLRLEPLRTARLDYAVPLAAALCPDGIIAISGRSLRIFTLPNFETRFHMETLPLSYTPRRMTTYGNIVYVVESDHRVLCPSARPPALQEGEDATLESDYRTFGLPRGVSGNWASGIRAVNTQQNESIFFEELDKDEAAFSIAVVSFATRPDAMFVVVGTAEKVSLAPRACTSAAMRTYQIDPSTGSLIFLHSTPLDDVPTCLISFQGHVLAGVGKALRLYSLGKKKLLRQTETRSFANSIMTLSVQGARILVGDIQDSLFCVVYKAAPQKRLLLFCDDTMQRWVTAHCMVDYETQVIADKFGNLVITRIPRLASEEADEDPTGDGLLREKGYLMGASHKLEMLANFHVGDLITSIHKVTLLSGGRDVILYTGVEGTIGVLIPLQSRSDVDFFSTLEMHMRSEASSLLGRDHLAYRSAYTPVKSIVDGDLCERYRDLDQGPQARIAEELDRTKMEVMKKLEQIAVMAGWI